MRWNLNSNACDVLGLGPRTAGLLATVGIRTVDELLVADSVCVAGRLKIASITADSILQWQHEARLLLALPELPSDGARYLAAAELSSVEQIGQLTPTELLAILESKRENSNDWLAKAPLPSIATVSEWIRTALQTKKSHAA